MPSGDPIWACPFCKKTYYDGRSCCDCPAWINATITAEWGNHTIRIPGFEETVDRVSTKDGPVVINNGPPVSPPNNLVTLDAGTSCPACGGDMITIRGKYANSDKRIVCPACLADCMDTIRSIVNKKK